MWNDLSVTTAIREKTTLMFGRRKSWEDKYDEAYAERAERADRRARRSTTWVHCAGMMIALALILAAIWLIAGRIMLEKTLTGLVSPVGIVWVGLLVVVYFGFLFRQTIPALIALAVWIVLTVFGNGWVSNQLVYSLEKDQIAFNADDLEPLDVLFVLGGGTTTTLQPMEEVTAAGDRVVTAARLFHAGKVKQIVCTGQQWNRADSYDMDPNEEAARLLAGLNVPSEQIARIAGRNTSEEMQKISEFLDQQQLTDKHVGIITSAWHVKRAQRLAQQNGVTAEMVPCDFRSGFFVAGSDLLLPSASNLDLSAACIKEYLAGLVGR